MKKIINFTLQITKLNKDTIQTCLVNPHIKSRRRFYYEYYSLETINYIMNNYTSWIQRVISNRKDDPHSYEYLISK